MAFPTNPTKGDTYDENGTIWTFNGVSWDRTIVASDNDTDYSSGAGSLLPSGGTIGQVLTRSASGGLEWGDGGGTDVSALISRIEALEAAVLTLQNTNNLLL